MSSIFCRRTHNDWQFKVLTLGMKLVDSDIAVSLSKCVKDVVSEFMPHQKKMLMFNTTDAASN